MGSSASRSFHLQVEFSQIPLGKVKSLSGSAFPPRLVVAEASTAKVQGGESCGESSCVPTAALMRWDSPAGLHRAGSAVPPFPGRLEESPRLLYARWLPLSMSRLLSLVFYLRFLFPLCFREPLLALRCWSTGESAPRQRVPRDSCSPCDPTELGSALAVRGQTVPGELEPCHRRGLRGARASPDSTLPRWERAPLAFCSPQRIKELCSCATSTFTGGI